jgi:pimeloyl-ACP methyl ester carboxylesterase
LLGRIAAPTLVIHADHTFPFVLEGAARLRHVNRHVQTQQVSDTHCFMQEQPANTAAQIKSFLLSA